MTAKASLDPITRQSKPLGRQSDSSIAEALDGRGFGRIYWRAALIFNQRLGIF